MVTTNAKTTMCPLSYQQTLDATHERYHQHLVRVYNKRTYKKATRQMMANLRSAISNTASVSSTVSETMPRLQEAADEVINTTVTAKTTLENINVAARAATDVLNQMKIAMTPIKIIWHDFDLVPTMLKIARIIANLAMSRTNCMVASLLLNISSEFGDVVVQTIKNWLFSPEVVLQNEDAVRHATRQGFDLGDLGAFAQVQNWLSSHTTLTVSALAVAIFGIMQMVLGLPKKGMDKQAMLAFFGHQSRHLKSIFDFGKSSWNIFTDVAEWIIQQVFPGMIKNGLDEYLTGYTKWSQAVLALVDAKNPFCERVKKEKKLVFHVSALYKQGMNYSKNLATLKVQDDLRDHFQKCFKLCESFVKEADHSGVLGNTPRIKPFIIQLFGESGVGKSGMLWPLCSDLNAALCDDEEGAKDIASEVYFRSAEQEFWDGYAGQNVCVWDDFGQLVDTSTNANPEFFEIIRAGNAAPYPLHMATLDEKARTKFISKFCILTSNVINQKISSITFPSAMRRRIDLLCKVEVKPEYTMEGTNKDTGETVLRLDPTKCKSGVDTDVYQFVVHDPESLQPVYDGEEGTTKKMDYEELVEYILKGASANFALSQGFNHSIADRITTSRFRKMRNLLMGGNPFNEFSKKKSAAAATRQVIESEFAEELLNEENLRLPAQPMPPTIPQNEVAEECVEVDSLEQLFYADVPVDQEALAQEIKPVKFEWLKDWKRKATSWIGIKETLVSVGLILGALGVWGLFKYFGSAEEQEQTLAMPIPEGFSSGDNKTKHVRVLRAEASCSGDSVTHKAKIVRSEGYGESSTVHLSKAISRALRHQLVSVDGWIPVETLLDHLKRYDLDRDQLCAIVRDDDKQRFDYNIVADKIRAFQGHSYEVDPSRMYLPSNAKIATHFTYVSRVESIRSGGIKKMYRAFVHLHEGHILTPPKSLPNRTVAVWVSLEGIKAWESGNGYILSENIPAKNIIAIEKMANKEASCSNDCRTKNLPRMKTEGDDDATLQAWKDKSAQELITHRILANLYRVSIDGVERLNGLFVRDTCMLTVEHLLAWLKKGTEITIENMYGAKFTVPISTLRTSVIHDSLGNSKDAMLVQFPRHINCHSDIIKHFQKMPELSHRRADVCLPCIRTLNDKRLFTILGNASCKIEHARVNFNGELVQIRDSLQYNLNTTSGDCGSPVIVNDTSFIRKIAGIHIAAYDDGSSAIGQSVTQADLLKHIYDMNPISVDHDDLPNMALKNATLQIDTSYSGDEIVDFLRMPAQTFGYISQCSRVVSPPNVSDLRQSPIYGYVTPITKPAKLWSREVNMIHRNMEKCAVNCPYIPQEEIDRAVGEVKALLLSGDSRERLARLLTFEEAVAGSPISEYIDGIKRQSSPGYPHCFNKKSEFPGKTTWFGRDEWEFSEEIRQMVEERIELAKRGIRYPTIWSDTLKDERRPIEKVDALKTRVFAAGPMDFTIAFRMYFLGFIAHIMENRITNEQSLGTNPFGADWRKTAKKLSRFGDKVFAGDFSQFDGTLNSCIMKEFAQVANSFYGDGEENARIRETLMLEIFNSIHLCDGKFIQLTHSQPSGNPLTTVLNSFYNSVSMRIAYYRCFDGKAPAFSDNVSMVSYGDDNVINFSDQVADRFNQNTVTQAYATFGMIYTDESKSTGEIAPWRKLSEVNYLKRNFRLEDGVYRAPLALETILESCNWVRKCPDLVEACVQNCETAFRELAQHPPAVFKENVELIAQALYKATNRFPVIQPRLVYLEDDSPAW